MPTVDVRAGTRRRSVPPRRGRCTAQWSCYRSQSRSPAPRTTKARSGGPRAARARRSWTGAVAADLPATGVTRVTRGQQSAHGWDGVRRPKRCSPPSTLNAAAFGAAALGAAALGAAALGAALGAEPAHAAPSPAPSPTTRAPAKDATAPGIVGSLLHDVVETPLDVGQSLPTAVPLPVPTTVPLPVPTAVRLPLPSVTAALSVEPSTAAPTRRPRARQSSPPRVPSASASPAARTTAPPSPPPPTHVTARASRASLPGTVDGRVPTRTLATSTARPLSAPTPPAGPLPGQPALVLAFVSAPAGASAGEPDQKASATNGPPPGAALRRGRAVLPFDNHATSRPVERGPPPPRQLLICHPRPRR